MSLNDVQGGPKHGTVLRNHDVLAVMVSLSQDFRGKGSSPANVLIPLDRQLIALQLCRWQLLYNETLQQTSRPLLSRLSQRRQIWVFDPHFEEVRGGVEPWLMAHWNVRVRLPIRHNWTFSPALTVDALQGKTCQTSLLSGEGGSIWAKISGARGRPSGIFFGFYLTVQTAVVLTQYRRVTDGQTDGINVASTGLAMRALRRAVKIAKFSTTRKFACPSPLLLVRPHRTWWQ